MKFDLCLTLFILFILGHSFAQTNFENRWEEVEKKEVQGLYHQLLDDVNEIYDLADKEENDRELVRAFLYKVKYDLLLKKDVESVVYRDFIDEIDRRQTPIKQLLSSVLAESLQDYVNRYDYRIRSRSQTESDSEETDFEFWTQESFEREIRKHYRASLQEWKTLRNLEDKDYTYLLNYGENYKKYRASLLDILVTRYQKYLSRRLKESGHFSDKQKIIFWEPSAEFIQADLLSPEELSPAQELMALFQKMEKIHRNDKTSFTLLTYEMDRLEQVFKLENRADKLVLYEEALQNLKKYYPGKNERAWIRLVLAGFYGEYADKHDRPDYYQKSLAELEPVLGRKDQPAMMELAKNLQRELTRSNLWIITENYGIPDRPLKALVEFKNIDTLYLAVYTGLRSELKKESMEADSIWKLLDDTKLYTQKTYPLSDVPKGFDYSAEVLLPQLPKGHYVLVFSDRETPDFRKDLYAWQAINSTQLAFTQAWDGKDLQFFVADRETGKPISEAELEVRLKTSSEENSHHLQTDKEGLASLQLGDEKAMDVGGFIAKSGDTLFLGNRFYAWKKEQDKQDREDAELHSYLLTDRKIFRPGQTLHFKGFVTFHQGQKQEMAHRFPVRVSLYDPENRLVEEKKLVTNKMGTVEGKFNLPKHALTGEYALEIEEDNNGRKRGEYADEFVGNRLNFQVEEYKRPRFEVIFEDLSETYFLGDSIRLTGKAKAFFGGNLTHARVRYTVTRELEYNYRLDYGYYRNHENPKILKTGELSTDLQGSFQLDFIADPDESVEAKRKPVYRYSVEVEVTDLNGETQNAKKVVRIGDHGISAEMEGLDEVVLRKEAELSLFFEDLNERKTKAQGKLKIYRYQVPTQIFEERPWPIPEFQQISKADFRKYFPYEAYDSLDLKENWPKELVKVLAVPESVEWKLEYDKINELESGEYVFEFEGVGPKNRPLQARKSVSLRSPDQPNALTELVRTEFEWIDRTKNAKLNARFEAVEPLYVLWEVADAKTWKYQRLLDLEPGENEMEIEIPENSQSLGTTYTIIKANRCFSKRQRMDREIKENERLHLEIEHFRDKIRPGTAESYTLRLVDENGKPVKAEVVASMYDTSLDGFIADETDWNIRLDEKPWYVHAATLNLFATMAYSFGTQRAIRFNTHWGSWVRKPLFFMTDLNTFGYSFLDIQRTQALYLGGLENKYRRVEEGAEEQKVSGKVMDKNGTPLPGVTIRISGSHERMTTDFEGSFSIWAKPDETLIFSYIGFNEVRKQVRLPYLVVQMESMGSGLEEVIMVGSENRTTVRILEGKAEGSGIEELELEGQAAMISRNQVADGTSADSFESGVSAMENSLPRENFKETAFFYPFLKTDRKGKVKITFKIPEALTKWKLQAFAHTKNLKQGYLQRHVLTQKELNVVPNFPRFFRAGDTVQISAKVNNLTDTDLKGQVLLKFTDEIRQKERTIWGKSVELGLKSLTLKKRGEAEAFWEVVIPEGVEALRYTISAKAENFTDAETDVIPVLSQRAFLTETLPLWVEPNQEKTFVLQNLRAGPSEGLQNHKLIFDFTTRPVWTAIEAMPSLTGESYGSSDRMVDRYYAYRLGARILKENKDIAELVESWEKLEEPENRWNQNEEVRILLLEESPWLQTAETLKEKQRKLARLLNAENLDQQQLEQLDRLSELQLPSGGFPWFKGGRESLPISIHILTHLGRLGPPVNENRLQEKYEEITKGLITYLDDRFLAQLVDKEEKIQSNFGRSTLYYLYARSFFEEGQKRVHSYQKQVLGTLESDWRQMDFHQKVILMLVAQKFAHQELATAILRALEESTVINSEEGMYWKENARHFGWYESPLISHSLAIEAFAQAGADSKTLNALKTWLIKQKQTQSWGNSRATLYALQALLIDAETWKKETALPEIWLGHKKLAWEPSEGKAGYFKKEFPPQIIKPEMGEVKIHNKGSSPQFGGLYWQYFENINKVKPVGTSELTLEKRIFVERSTEKGKTKIPIENANPKVGDRIIVQLKIKSLANFEFMHLKDARIAGVEPLTVLSEYQSQDGLYFYATHRDAATHFFFDRLPKGSYLIEYKAVVNNVGNFSIGIGQLQSLYAPEFTAQTSGKRVEFEGMKFAE